MYIYSLDLAHRDLEKEKAWRQEATGLNIEQLEALITSIPGNSEDNRYRQYTLLEERKHRLNSTFEYSEINTQALLRVNQSLMNCFRQANSAAEKIKKKLAGSIGMDAYIKINVSPVVSAKNSKIYDVLDDVMHKSLLRYPYVDDLHKNIHFSKNLSWNIEGLGARGYKSRMECDPSDIKENVFANNYICYGMHELYAHSSWSLQDIIRIKKFDTKIEVTFYLA